MRRLAVLVVACALASACTGDGRETAATSLPPTTAAATPSAPAGAADVVRRWVAALDQRDLERAHALLAAESQARVGGPDGLIEERGDWARWATVEAAVFDALPITDDLAMVVLRARFGEGSSRAVDAAAVPVRRTDEGWSPDPFGDVGTFDIEPVDGSEVEREPTIVLTVDPQVRPAVYVDGQPAVMAASTQTEAGRQRIELHVPRPLRPGEHVVAVMLLDGDGDAAARAVSYLVSE